MSTFTLCLAGLVMVMPFAYITILIQKYRRFNDAECRRAYVTTSVIAGIIFTVAACGLVYDIVVDPETDSGGMYNVCRALTWAGIFACIMINQCVRELSDRDREITKNTGLTNNEMSV